ncbi:uncharacterized protein A4U43_C08F29540 [Asparagus officinalis]|nr:uncharacterized protein A4U43_C08F29540 [Asparagus officinalis]
MTMLWPMNGTVISWFQLRSGLISYRSRPTYLMQTLWLFADLGLTDDPLLQHELGGCWPYVHVSSMPSKQRHLTFLVLSFIDLSRSLVHIHLIRMSYLNMMEARLPPGFRFHPRDEELVCDYLTKKISGDKSGSLFGCPTMIDVDLNKCEPWDLPEIACVGGKEWYFYSLRDRKYATGQRTNRATVSGYWKATGKDRHVTRRGVLVGMRKTLVFYRGRAPKGRKTDWVMHEFRMEVSDDKSKFSVKLNVGGL